MSTNEAHARLAAAQDESDLVANSLTRSEDSVARDIVNITAPVIMPASLADSRQRKRVPKRK